MKKRISKGKLLWGTAGILFLAACAVKWYYLAQQHYHVRLAAEALITFDMVDRVPFAILLKKILLVYCSPLVNGQKV